MAKLINHKVQGATLIEVIIAMVIIMVIFTIALKVFNNVLSSGVSLKKIQVQNQLNVLSKEVIANGKVLEPKLKIDSVDYDFYQDTTSIIGLYRLEIKASQHRTSLGSIKLLYNSMEQ